MPKTKFKFPIILFIFFGFPVLCSAGDDTATCLKALRPLKVNNEFVADRGGIWGLFEKASGFDAESGLGVQLDSKINRLLVISTHFCETLNGIPFNDMASFLTYNLKTKSRKNFKEELMGRGWPGTEVDLWFEFVDFAQKSQSRKLDMNLVLLSMNRVGKLLESYKQLAMDLENTPSRKLLKDAKELAKRADELQTGDAMLAQGYREIQAAPRWDLDGSSGGS